MILSQKIESGELIQKMRNSMAVVSVEGDIDGVDCVGVENKKGIYMAVENLIENGHKKIGFIGCGNMGQAMIGGIVKSGLVPPEQVYAADPSEQNLNRVQKEYGICVTQDNLVPAKKCDILVLSVKPYLYENAPFLYDSPERLCSHYVDTWADLSAPLTLREELEYCQKFTNERLVACWERIASSLRRIFYIGR